MKNDPREGFLKSGGYRLHYLLWGASGPRLVLLHSMGMDAHSFDALSDSLQEEHQILAFDILDHGESDKPKEPIGVVEHAEIIRDGYRQLGSFPNVLIGHSVGGRLGMILAAEHPDEFKGLVLVDIAPIDPGRKYTPPPPPPEFFEDEEEARKYVKSRYPRFTEWYVDNRLKYAFFKDEKGKLRIRSLGDTLRRNPYIALWPYVERIETPTLLILGSESDLISPATVERMKSTMPSFEVVTVENATHMVPQDKPGVFEQHVKRFLKKVT